MTEVTEVAWPEPIQDALRKTAGAVFRRCVLQVNPFGYVQRHRPATSFTDEDGYNAAIVEACRRAGVTVVGITDHHTVDTMRGLREALTDSGITVFPGFEAQSSDGVQALVLFDPSTTEQQLEEQQRRYQAAGVQERLREQSLLVREENLLGVVASRLAPLQEAFVPLPEAARPDRAFLAPAAIVGLPNDDLLAAADAVLERLESVAGGLVDALAAVLADACTELEALRAQWRARRDQRQEEFDRRLRELQADHVDGSEFLRMRRALEGMLPLRERADRLDHERGLLLEERASLLTDWTALRAEEHAAMDNAARFASERLHRKVRVATVADGDTGPLMELIRNRVGGRLDRVERAVADGVSPADFADWCRRGAAVVMERLGVTENQAERLCGAGPSAVREIEELDLAPRTDIELNVGTVKTPLWRPYSALSKGQKAAALLLLLIGDDAPGPLVVDQPEDDLDNAFIFQTIVPSMRAEKRRRQFHFASHDPNIPVLGDAELIAELSTEIVGDDIVGRIGAGGRLGSIDVVGFVTRWTPEAWPGRSSR